MRRLERIGLLLEDWDGLVALEPFELARRRVGDMMTEGRLGRTRTGGWQEFEPKQD